MRFQSVKFGPFPHQLVNETLNTELDGGNVYCSARAQEHIYRDHQPDFELVMANLEAIVLNPSYIGQSPRHGKNIEFIKRIAVQEADESGAVLRRYYILVAVGLEPDEHGDYRVRSGYVVKETDVNEWRLKGNLRIPRQNK